MKRIYSILSLLALVLLASACDPMAKINKQLDEKETYVTKTTTYTLTKADYTKLAGEYVKIKMADFQGSDEEKKAAEAKFKKEASSLTAQEAFNDQASASLLVPSLLSTLYPEWSKGSTVDVSYRQVAKRSEKQQAVWNSTLVELEESDLQSKGIADIYSLSEENITAIVALAKEKNPEAKETILVKLTLAGKSRFVVIIDGKEASTKDYYSVQPNDYKEMGLKYGNFSSSAKPEDFIPKLLALKFPYAKEGDSKVVLYVWHANRESSAKSLELVLQNGSWAPAARVEEKVDQFLHNGEKWLFDPTIVFTMDASDFAILHQYVKDNHPNYISSKYPDNEEHWFGGSGYYKNFNLDGGATQGERPEEEGLSSEELAKVKLERIAEGLKLVLASRYPSYPATVNGVEQFYIVHTEIRYNRQNETRTFRYKGLGDNNYEYLPEATK